jgi:glycosyltransferase involved in cell wall biosynthesis
VRILVLTPTFLPTVGGAELAIYEIYRRLSASHQVRVLTRKVGKKQSRGLNLGDVNIEVVKFQDKVTLKKKPRAQIRWGTVPPFSLSAVEALLRACRQFKPDVINAHYFVPTGLAAVLAQCLLGIPVVLSLVGRDVPGPATPTLWKHYGRMIAGLAADVICVSEYCRCALYGSPNGGKGQTIHYGADISEFSPQVSSAGLRRKLGLRESARVLFALQRLSREKKVEVVIESMGYVAGEMNDVVLIVGGEGPEEARLRELSTRIGVSDRVIFAGFIPQEELPHYYSLADLFVFHSLYETFGIVLAQALASGTPVVSVNCTAIPELVEDGVDGVLVPPNGPRQLALGIMHLLKDAPLREIYGKRAREKALAKFNWDTIAQHYKKVLQNAVSTSGLPRGAIR